MAKSISVAVADIETMASGCASIVRSPLSPVTVTGKACSSAVDDVDAASSADDELPPPQAVRARARGSNRVAARDRQEWNGNTKASGVEAAQSPTSEPNARCATLAARVGNMTQGRRSG